MPRTNSAYRSTSPVGGMASNPGIPMAGGTLGGRPSGATRRPGGRSLALGDEVYLWVLLIVEVFAMGALRQKFRKHHGG